MRGDLEYLEFIAESIQLVTKYTRHGKDHFLPRRHNRGYRGMTPRDLRRRLDKICAEFNTTAAGIRASTGSDHFEAVHAATRLYAKVLDHSQAPL